MASAAEPLIRVVDLHRDFAMGEQTVHALDGITAEVAMGEFLGIMGPSGSGKSTLLYLLGGLDRPTEGRIRVHGQELTALDENELARYRQREVGFIFQSFHLVPTMTALQNVEFPMVFAGISPQERHERASALLAQVGLEDRATHKPTELSGGQQQRVAIARALINDPALILADEPTGNLDTSSGTAIMQALVDLQKAGKTILVATHDPRMLTIASDSIFLLDGKQVSEAQYRETIEIKTWEGVE